MNASSPSTGLSAGAGAPALTAKAWWLLILLSLVWGGSFFFAEVALDQYGPLTVVTARVGGAAVTLWLVALAMGQDLRALAAMAGPIMVMALLNNIIPFNLIVWGQTSITGGLASILNATTPIFAVVVLHFTTTDERLTINRILGVSVGFVGVAVMLGPDLLTLSPESLAGQVAVLLAALSYAFAGAYGKRFSGMPPMLIATGQATASTLVMLPIAAALEQPWLAGAPSLEVAGALVGIATLSTALAYLLYFRILAIAGAGNLLLVTLMIPPSAILLGVLILGEPIDGRQLTGMALIAAALIAIDGRLIRLSSRR